MTTGWYDASRTLARAAQRVAGRHDWPLPPLIVLTDPQRYPDIERFAATVPPESVLILRHFGRGTALREAVALRRIADDRALILLIAADPDLARDVEADGVHWPERLLDRARLHHPAGMTLTASAHSLAAARRAAALGAQGVLVSPVFATSSPGSGSAMGMWPAAAIARNTDAPVYALGGIKPANAARLGGLGFAGLATVSGLRS